jgi:hypothetical protein
MTITQQLRTDLETVIEQAEAGAGRRDRGSKEEPLPCIMSGARALHAREL